jgi:hypothetical protein
VLDEKAAGRAAWVKAAAQADIIRDCDGTKTGLCIESQMRA